MAGIERGVARRLPLAARWQVESAVSDVDTADGTAVLNRNPEPAMSDTRDTQNLRPTAAGESRAEGAAERSSAAPGPGGATPTGGAGDRPAGGVASAAAQARDAGIDAIRPMVADLRSKLATLASQEIELQRREAQVAQQMAMLERRARDVAARELDGARARLEERSNELDAQAIELSARRAHLDRIEAQLAGRDRKLTQQQREIENASQRLQQRIDEEKSQRASDRRILARRIDVIREREKELERRIRLARDEIVQERATLDERLSVIEKRTAELEALRTDVGGLEAEWQRRFAELDLRESEIADIRQAAQEQVQDAERRAREFESASKKLEEERAGLIDRQRELDEQWRQTREQRSKTLRQVEELGAKQRTVQDQAAALDARRQRIEAQEKQLAARTAAIEAEAGRLGDRLNELEQRSRALDDREQGITAQRREADRLRDEAHALRELAEQRDSETRQAALSLELETQNIERERVVIEQQHAEILTLREQREAELQRATSELARKADEIRRSEAALFGGSKRWPIRAGVLSAAAGAIAALVILAIDPALYRAQALLRLTTAGPAERAAAEHAARIMTAGLLESHIATPESAAGLRAARERDGFAARPTEQGAGIELELGGRDAAAAQRVASDAATAYATMVNTTGPAAVAPDAFADLEARRSAAREALEKSQAAATLAEAELKKLADPATRDALVADVAGLRRRHDELNAALAAAREELAGVLGGGEVRGLVKPEEVDAALRSDDVYQEDTKEFRLATREYQNELAVAMVLLVDPLKSAREASHALGEVVDEQRQLSPPTAIAAILESIATQLTQFQEESAKFAQEWETARHAVEHLRVQDDVVELVQQQSEAARGSRRITQQCQGLLAELKRQVDAIGGEGNGGTREIVVASVLRSELAKLTEQFEGLRPAADATDTTTNFELDARDKKIRGLRTRMTARKAAVTEQLQAQADFAAQQDRGSHTETLRVRTRSLEQERDETVATLVKRVDELRGLDESVAQRQRTQSTLDANRGEEARLTAQIRQLDDAIAQAKRSGPTPDRIEVGEIATVQSGGLHRVRNALIGFVGAAALSWGVCLLLLVRNPLRRGTRSPNFAGAGSPR